MQNKPATSEASHLNRSAGQPSNIRRIERKPTRKTMVSPKDRCWTEQFEDFNLDKSLSTKLDQSQRSENGDCQGLLMGFVSPKGIAQGKFSWANLGVKNVEEHISICNIGTEESIPVDEPKPATRSKRKSFTRTNKPSPTCMLGPTKQYTTMSSAHEDEVRSLKQQNKELLEENSRLMQRLSDIKEENEYLYGQIEKLNGIISQTKSLNEELADQNRELWSRLDQYESDLRQNEEKSYFNQMKGAKTIGVLEHVFLKLKAEYREVCKLNDSLEEQNKNLEVKVECLQKKLAAHRGKSFKFNQRSNTREASPIYNKQNVRANRAEGHQYDSQASRFSKNSRKQESIFELSPE